MGRREGSIDLTDESKYCTFYNSADYPFSNFYPATVETGGVVYKCAASLLFNMALRFCQGFQPKSRGQDGGACVAGG